MLKSGKQISMYFTLIIDAYYCLHQHICLITVQHVWLAPSLPLKLLAALYSGNQPPVLTTIHNRTVDYSAILHCTLLTNIILHTVGKYCIANCQHILCCMLSTSFILWVLNKYCKKSSFDLFYCKLLSNIIINNVNK